MPNYRFLLSIVVASTLAMGCTTTGELKEEEKFVGVIQQSQKVSYYGDAPSKLWMGLGLIGGLVSAAAYTPNTTNLYDVLVSGKTRNVTNDDDWPVGTCVEIVPSTKLILGSFPEAKISQSDKC